MERISDIIYMLLGIGMLVATAIGAINLGVWGYLGSFACIGYGAVALYKMHLAASALKSELLGDPQVVQFYRNTMDAWASGRLAGLNASFQKEGSLAYEDFVKKYRPIEGGALSLFFRQYPPQPGELLVQVGDADKAGERAWFLLTDKRLILKDGGTGQFRELVLADIAGFDKKGWWTKTITFRMKSGGESTFEKLELIPNEAWLNFLLAAG